jgi:hypothetical protein
MRRREFIMLLGGATVCPAALRVQSTERIRVRRLSKLTRQADLLFPLPSRRRDALRRPSVLRIHAFYLIRNARHRRGAPIVSTTAKSLNRG